MNLEERVALLKRIEGAHLRRLARIERNERLFSLFIIASIVGPLLFSAIYVITHHR